MGKVVIEKVTGDLDLRKACEATMHGQQSRVPLDKLYRAEHSPIRTQLFWVHLIAVPTFVSVHLVRHKIGVEHFVKSMRDDLYIDPEEYEKIDRNTPVNHSMFINAHSLINLSRKRLCLKSHAKTVAWMSRIRKAMAEADPVLRKYMVPECVYRNGMCPEITECGPGLVNVCRAYGVNVNHVEDTESTTTKTSTTP